jgi:hypothetical protein
MNSTAPLAYANSVPILIILGSPFVLLEFSRFHQKPVEQFRSLTFKEKGEAIIGRWLQLGVYNAKPDYHLSFFNSD